MYVIKTLHTFRHLTANDLTEYRLMFSLCVSHQLHLFDFCSSRGLGTRGTLVTTGRSRPVRCICTPASVQAPLELYTKGNGMVGMHFRQGRVLSGVTTDTLSFSLVSKHLA